MHFEGTAKVLMKVSGLEFISKVLKSFKKI